MPEIVKSKRIGQVSSIAQSNSRPRSRGAVVRLKSTSISCAGKSSLEGDCDAPSRVEQCL